MLDDIDLTNLTKIPSLDIKLTKGGDLVYHDGPLLSHFYDENKNHYIMYWWCSSTHNRWLLYHTPLEILLQYFDEKITLRDTILATETAYLLDIGADKNDKVFYESVYQLKTKDILDKDLPSDKSFFNDNHAEDYAIELKELLNK